MALGKTALYYRSNPEARVVHQASSKKGCCKTNRCKEEG